MPRHKPEDLVAVVLAGGFGTRVRHLLPGIPKPMASVAGRPFLEWVVRFLAKQSLKRVILSTGFLAEVIERHFADQPVSGVQVRSVREVEPLGTAGGFLHAVHSSSGQPAAWLVLNGDSLCFGNVSEAAARLDDFAGLLVGCSVSDASRYGTLGVGPAGDLMSFQEKRPGHGIINAGMYLLQHAVISQFPKASPLSFEQDVFPALTKLHVRLGVNVVPGPFLDIGTPESLKEAEAFVVANQDQFLISNQRCG